MKKEFNKRQEYKLREQFGQLELYEEEAIGLAHSLKGCINE